MESKPHQVIPVAAQGLPDSTGSGYQDVGLSGLDLLDGANVQVSSFGQFFLRDFELSPNTAHVASKCFELFCDELIHYGILWRNKLVDRTAQQGVNSML